MKNQFRGIIRLRRRPRLRAGTSIEKESRKLHFGVQARACPWGSIAVLLLVFFSSPRFNALSDEIYKWKDRDGNVVFSDTPPPPGVEREIKEFKEGSTERQETREYFPRAKSESGQEKRPYREIRVIMYMTSWCPHCDKARNHLRSLGVNLVEYDIEKDKSKREEMLRKSGGSRGVPLIDVEGIILKGYNANAIRSAIEERKGK